MACGLPSRAGSSHSPPGKHVVNIRGFTLVELMVTIVVAGLILAIGVPAFSTIGATLRHREVREALKQRLQGARQAAVTRRRPVIVSFGDGVRTAEITTYRVHVDANADGVLQPAESSSSYRLPHGTSLGTSGLDPVDTLIFAPSGALRRGTTGGRLYVSGGRIPDTLAVAATGMVYRP